MSGETRYKLGMRTLIIAWAILIFVAVAANSQMVTLTGTLQSSNGMPASNYILSFTPSQMGFISGTGVVINAASYCATSVDGSVVGVPNPLGTPVVTPGFTGSLAPANYFTKILYYDASGNVTLASPERVVQLNSTGQISVAPPVGGLPSGAAGMKVYISTATNLETLQGTSTGSAAYVQSVPLVTGANPPSTNTTICKQIANDVIWPSGTGYTVALTDTGGNTLPGYPMQWQLMGPNTTINLSTGLPYYHGTVYFPTPILASPLNHALQTISGPLGLSGYNLSNVGAIGVGTSLPGWPVDNEIGATNSLGGYLVNGAAGTAGQCLSSDGTAFNTPADCGQTNVPWSCQPGLSGGLSAIPTGTYSNQIVCRNDTGHTWTLTSIRCMVDTGTSTCNATDNLGNALLTGAITGTSTWAAGTQGATTTIPSGGWIKATFVLDGTSTQIGMDFSGTY